MQPNAERCPKCGKLKSVTFISPTAAAAAPAVPAYYVQNITATVGPDVFIPYANSAAASATQPPWSGSSFEFCWCR